MECFYGEQYKRANGEIIERKEENSENGAKSGENASRIVIRRANGEIIEYKAGAEIMNEGEEIIGLVKEALTGVQIGGAEMGEKILGFSNEILKPLQEGTDEILNRRAGESWRDNKRREDERRIREIKAEMETRRSQDFSGYERFDRKIEAAPCDIFNAPPSGCPR